MNWRRLKNNRSIGDRKGQIAIFVALIFQLLFLFFAMVVNVGLLVHHKINLQNSVDLAAYYGAMKQAEVLNAIGHVNYQIRQSYKLLAWRYRVLGTAAIDPDVQKQFNIVKKGDISLNGSGTIDGTPRDGEPAPNWATDPQYKDYANPAFCIFHQPYSEANTSENPCHLPMGISMAALQQVPTIASFIGAVSVAQTLTDAASRSRNANCVQQGPINFGILAEFIVAYQVDQAQKKMLIYHLANGISDKTDDFIDIEGGTASDGIKATLNANLTAANLETLEGQKPTIYNGLGAPDCAGTTGSAAAPPKWMREISTYLSAVYMTCTVNNNANAQSPVAISSTPAIGGVAQPIQDLVTNSAPYLSPRALTGANKIYLASLGVEKNPWCMAYVGVKASTKPQIPFSLGTVTLKAVGFAKPFGGKIGPWYGKMYRRVAGGESEGTETQRTDPLTTMRCANGVYDSNCMSSSGGSNTDFRTLNYSRFPGDKAGLQSQVPQALYGKSLFDLGPHPAYADWNEIANFPGARNGGQGEYDLLSSNPNVRRLEIAAVAPDLFDLTYYSIDPDFYTNYYKDRLKTYLDKDRNPIVAPQGGGTFFPSFDIGSKRKSNATGADANQYDTGFGVKNQLAILSGMNLPLEPTKFGLDFTSGTGAMNDKVFLPTPFDTNNPLYGQFLTSWLPPLDMTTDESVVDRTRFGKCTMTILDNEGKLQGGRDPVPGSCIQGGRTGYSVKMISSDYLLDEYPLGGGSTKNKILNQPPPDFLK